jgi:ribosomal protein S18 acetylase RimI-like enzyme
VKRGPYSITNDPSRIDLDQLHALLQTSYWANERPKSVIEKTLKHSLCFGVLKGGELVGFARAVTDYATYAYLCDVIVDQRCRGQGLGKWLIECVMEEPRLKTVKSWALMTTDAHGLYRKFGFTEITDPEKIMWKRG